jgi:hypothetical protein
MIHRHPTAIIQNAVMQWWPMVIFDSKSVDKYVTCRKDQTLSLPWMNRNEAVKIAH